ncbi:MAG: iron ABC transporter permease [Chloroflexi bacterium]|nr:iron ABC transporter permease [Chloroflexota bacterium]MYD65145.1 iron ABC transporter permease [Chloroflexota bacterium]
MIRRQTAERARDVRRGVPRGAWWRLWQRGEGSSASSAAPAFALLTVLLVVAVLLNAGIGAVRVPPAEVATVLLNRVGISTGIEVDVLREQVVWGIRMPRIVLAICVGAGLGMAGASLQAIFRNPLAEPGLIGVSSGGALGAIVLIITGVAPLGWLSLPLAAFAGALLLTLVVYGLARSDGRTQVVTLILTGVAMNSIAGGLIGLAGFLADDAELRSIVFWTLGSLAGATWRVVLPVALMTVFGLVLLPHARAMNLIVLGEREAFHLGVSTERVRVLVIVVSTLVVGAGVAVAGIVVFVGLVVPHLLRIVIGPDHRVLLPASALGGAILLLGADLVARTIVVPAELPLGVVTALIGGPYFLFLLRRTTREQGGWM